MQTLGVLGARDKARLGTYEEMAQNRPGSEILVARQRSFTLVRNRMSSRDLLDEITRLDDEYDWKNYGTDNASLVVIQPRTTSALDWAVPPLCKTQPTQIDEILAGCNGQECGSFTKLLSDHNLSVFYMYMGPVSPGKPEPDLRPHGFIDLCSDGLTARDVLNRIAKSSGTSWTLGGIKGMRLISFAPVGGK
jgi:hypothetical protein